MFFGFPKVQKLGPFFALLCHRETLCTKVPQGLTSCNHGDRQQGHSHWKCLVMHYVLRTNGRIRVMTLVQGRAGSSLVLVTKQNNTTQRTFARECGDGTYRRSRDTRFRRRTHCVQRRPHGVAVSEVSRVRRDTALIGGAQRNTRVRGIRRRCGVVSRRGYRDGGRRAVAEERTEHACAERPAGTTRGTVGEAAEQ